MMFGIEPGLVQHKSKMRLEYALWRRDWKQLRCLPGLSNQWIPAAEHPCPCARRERVLVAQAPCFWWCSDVSMTRATTSGRGELLEQLTLECHNYLGSIINTTPFNNLCLLSYSPSNSP